MCSLFVHYVYITITFQHLLKLLFPRVSRPVKPSFLMPFHRRIGLFACSFACFVYYLCISIPKIKYYFSHKTPGDTSIFGGFKKRRRWDSNPILNKVFIRYPEPLCHILSHTPCNVDSLSYLICQKSVFLLTIYTRVYIIILSPPETKQSNWRIEIWQERKHYACVKHADMNSST